MRQTICDRCGITLWTSAPTPGNIPHFLMVEREIHGQLTEQVFLADLCPACVAAVREMIEQNLSVPPSEAGKRGNV